jgi:hypothetical protein
LTIGPFQIHRHRLVEGFRRQVRGRPVIGVGGRVIDQDIEATALLFHELHQLLDLREVAGIAAVRERLAPGSNDGVSHRLHALDLAARADDFRAAVGETVGDRLPDAA